MEKEDETPAPAPVAPETAEEEVEFRVYRRRWLVLTAVSMSNIAINILLYSYSTVANDAAAYFDKETSDINTFTTIGMVASLIVSLFATWLIERLGLRLTVILAGVLCLAGGILRMLSTFPTWNEDLDKDVQYGITLVAQTLVGLANPLAFSLPTKVSNDWFPEVEAPMASGFIIMSFLLGMVVGVGFTPIIFSDEDLIQWMNIAWSVPSMVSFVCSITLITSDQPPSPPSKSTLIKNKLDIPYLKKMKMLLTNKNFLVLMFSVGGVFGYINGIVAMITQITCTSGYTSEFTGIGVTALQFCGLFGCIGTSFLIQRTGLVEELAKVMFGIAGLLSMPILYLLLQEDQEIALGILLALAGLATFGIMPTGAELTLENTYPLEAATGLSLVYGGSSQISIIIVLVAAGYLAEELDPDEYDDKKQTCTDDDSDVDVMDYTNYILFLMCYITAIALVFILFMRSEYHHRHANHEKNFNLARETHGEIGAGPTDRDDEDEEKMPSGQHDDSATIVAE